MIQEKPTSLRLLQTNKKKSLSPIIYVLIGFISGVAFTLLISFVFFMSQQKSNTEVNNVQTEQEHPVLPVETKNESSKEIVVTPTHDDAMGAEEDNNLVQPGSNDLNKFFQHAPAVPIAPTEQRSSPFANEPNKKVAHPPLVVKSTTTANRTTSPQNNNISKSIQTNEPKSQVTEPEVEAPQATVQIKVTQKPFTVNELH
ncbi:hypothetical protein [Acinetobacter venetianus]|jgi:hypothetical protein|uniref:hypothetical protein n=1 Tax=Acinetobacter venetianus TaxID=52133 RepID=UPI000AB917C4